MVTAFHLSQAMKLSELLLRLVQTLSWMLAIELPLKTISFVEIVLCVMKIEVIFVWKCINLDMEMEQNMVDVASFLIWGLISVITCIIINGNLYKKVNSGQNFVISWLH